MNMSCIFQYNLCRLCLCTGKYLVDIFEENGGIDFVVEDAIQDLLQFQVVKEASVPWNVCQNCLEKLANFRLFKRNCIECKVTYESRYYEESRSMLELSGQVGDALPAIVTPKISVTCDSVAFDATSAYGSNQDLDVPARLPVNGFEDPLGEDSGSDYCKGYNESSTESAYSGESSSGFDVGEWRTTCCRGRNVEDDGPPAAYALDHVDRGDSAAADQVAKCVLCCRSFRRVHNLRRHLRLVHNSEMDPRDQRKGPGTRIPSTEPHESVIVSDFPAGIRACRIGTHKCTKCGKRFPTRRRLQRHLVVHREGAKQYRCGVCASSFTRPSNLRAHVKVVHHKERDYPCTVCGQAFSHRGHLNTHMRTHGGEKPHACTICGWRFSRIVDATKHVAMHRKHLREA